MFNQVIYGRFEAMGAISKIIQIATLSQYSHVGIIAPYKVNNRKKLGLWESTTLNKIPDQITNRYLKGVQVTDPDDRLLGAMYDRIDVHLYRLRDALSRSETEKLYKYAMKVHGSEYDTGGAIWSGTKLLKRIFSGESLKSFFCSEFCSVMLREAKRWNGGNPSNMNPSSLIKEITKKGISRKIYAME